jgi:chromosome segregation ATPase
LKEMQLRVVDLEAAVVSDPSRNMKRLDAKIIELNDTIDRLTRERDDMAQNSRRQERQSRDLTQQLSDKEKLRQRQEEELIKLTDRFRKTKQELIDLVSDAALMLNLKCYYYTIVVGIIGKRSCAGKETG